MKYNTNINTTSNLCNSRQATVPRLYIVATRDINVC